MIVVGWVVLGVCFVGWLAWAWTDPRPVDRRTPGERALDDIEAEL